MQTQKKYSSIQIKDTDTEILLLFPRLHVLKIHFCSIAYFKPNTWHETESLIHVNHQKRCTILFDTHGGNLVAIQQKQLVKDLNRPWTSFYLAALLTFALL